jgi:TolB-like protein/Flp pilus assembly protein TadD
VLAFTNMTGEAADDWIGQGMAETLTADLKKVRQLWVISREQIFDQLRRLPGQLDERQTIEVGRRLGASWVVAGAYQRIGDRLRITARVIDLATGAPAGSMRVDGRVDELFDLQDRLVLDIAASLELQLAESEIGTIVGGDTRSIDAYQAYSLGMLNLRMASRESIERAVALFERAIGLDPDYAEAVAGLGAAYQLKADFLSLGDLNARSLALLRRALALKPSLADVQVRLAGGLQMDGDVDGALAILHDAVGAQPESAVAQAALGRLYWMGKGMIPEAMAFLETAAALNPESGYTHLQLALLYALTGRLDEAEQAARIAVNLQELAMSGTQGLLIVGAHTRLGYVHYRRGHYDEAIGEYRRELAFLGASDHALRERTQIELHQKLSAAFHRKGDEASARTHADRAVGQFHQRVAAGADDPSTRYYLGALFALQGDVAAALSHLQYPLRVLGPLTRWRLASDPDFDPVRDALASALA